MILITGTVVVAPENRAAFIAAVTRHGRRDKPPAHQYHRQIAVIRTDICQPRPDRHMGRHPLKAHGQCVLIHCKSLMFTNI